MVPQEDKPKKGKEDDLDFSSVMEVIGPGFVIPEIGNMQDIENLRKSIQQEQELAVRGEQHKTRQEMEKVQWEALLQVQERMNDVMALFSSGRSADVFKAGKKLLEELDSNEQWAEALGDGLISVFEFILKSLLERISEFQYQYIRSNRDEKKLAEAEEAYRYFKQDVYGNVVSSLGILYQQHSYNDLPFEVQVLDAVYDALNIPEEPINGSQNNTQSTTRITNRTQNFFLLFSEAGEDRMTFEEMAALKKRSKN